MSRARAEPDLDVVRPPAVLEPVSTKHLHVGDRRAPLCPTLFGGGRLEGA